MLKILFIPDKYFSHYFHFSKKLKVFKKNPNLELPTEPLPKKEPEKASPTEKVKVSDVSTIFTDAASILSCIFRILETYESLKKSEDAPHEETKSIFLI